MKYNSFLSILKAEHYKTKRNLGILLIVLLPLIITLFVDLYMTYNYLSMKSEYTANPWTTLLARYIFPFYSFIYPSIIAIFCYSLCDIEYRNNSLRQLFTLPISKYKIYIAKIVVMIEVILFSILLAYALFMISGHTMGAIFKMYGFQNYDSHCLIAVFFIKMFIGSITIAFLQLFISLTFRSFAIPVGIASFGVVLSLLAYTWKYVFLIPYASIYKAYFSLYAGSTELLDEPVYANCVYIVLLSVLCYFVFIGLVKKDSK